MVLYFFSGLGADKRVFKKLRLPEHVEIRHVEWIQPQPEESLKNYVRRLSAVIQTDKPFCLIGLSFGGIVAA
ncbi:MAG: alpha/beta fold hydrolase, partial [Cytophaga sp.]|uniref:alpha/beta fold hydrolase n=1 Tax=Cytophaga sp. TaxID=29535 RepID=UPI003F811290